MERPVLIETSSWIEALRRQGDPRIRWRVGELLAEGRAAWCDMVAVELWNGAQGEYERKRLAELDQEMIRLPATTEVGQTARHLARLCRIRGKTIPPTDLLILSCALVHQVELEHQDAHFETVLRLHADSS